MNQLVSLAGILLLFTTAASAQVTKTTTTKTRTTEVRPGETVTESTATETTTPPAPTLSCAPTESLPILITNPFKIKVVTTVSSSTARTSDYVEFLTQEDIYSVAVKDSTKDCPTRILVPKGTQVFGIVTKGNHRHFPFTNGKLEVQLLPIKTWNNLQIPVEIARYDPKTDAIKNVARSEKLKADSPKSECKPHTLNCVTGRRNASVAAILPGIATVTSTAVTAAVAKDKTTRIIAATALLALASQTSISELLNGTDAQLNEGRSL